MKKIMGCTIATIMCIMFAGCGNVQKNAVETKTSETNVVETEVAQPTETVSNKTVSVTARKNTNTQTKSQNVLETSTMDEVSQTEAEKTSPEPKTNNMSEKVVSVPVETKASIPAEVKTSVSAETNAAFETEASVSGKTEAPIAEETAEPVHEHTWATRDHIATVEVSVPKEVPEYEYVVTKSDSYAYFPATNVNLWNTSQAEIDAYAESLAAQGIDNHHDDGVIEDGDWVESGFHTEYEVHYEDQVTGTETYCTTCGAVK